MTLSQPMLRIALLGIAGFFGATTADAAIFWSDSDPMVMSQPAPPPQPKRHKQPRRSGTRPTMSTREAVKPQGPLVIAISIDRQSLRVYDANGLYAESPVSTGMRGHSTPMGTFSVIQKNKYHRSNIYSGAPMPYMQRITWSGIAMHAGVLPGYPASHGCIRLPMAFAVKLWGWTRMGARVVIAPGELSPSDFSHPLLTAPKPVPVASATAVPEKTPVTLQDTIADAKPDLSSASLELKPSLAQDHGGATAGTGMAARRDQTQTADASGALLQAAGTASVINESPAPLPTTNSSPLSATAKSGTTEFNDKAAEFRAATDKLLDGEDVAKRAPETVAVEAQVVTGKPAEPAEEAPADASKKTVASAPEPAKDQSRQIDAEQPSMAKPDPSAQTPKRSGQVAVLVSRKDSKLYVRQNFAPLFDVPVTIASSDRPLGTHVFTARADKDDAKTLRWSVLSLPVPARSSEDDGATRRRKATGAIDMKTTPLPDTAAEALDRVKIPDDVMTRIAEVMATGGSIIVSDQGIAAGGETGQGTEFIVPLR